MRTAEGLWTADVRGTVRPVTKVVWAVLAGLHAALAVWLFAEPVGLPSDDAFNFAHGLVHFSVLEFSPHFPGYPGFVVLGRAVLPFARTPEQALTWLTLACALMLPVALAWSATRLAPPVARARVALAAYAIGLSQPLLPALGLSLLDDASGLLFFLVFIGLAAERRGLWAGICLGASLCCRPSEAPMLMAAGLALLILDRRSGWRALLGTALVAVPLFGGVVALEGVSYFYEGWRFLQGHTELWGNTAFSRPIGAAGWLAAILAVPGGGVLLGLLTLGIVLSPPDRRELGTVVVWVALAVEVVWIALMQNPDHLRHLAAIALLAGLLVASRTWTGPRRWLSTGVAIAQTAVLAFGLSAGLRPPPLADAVSWLERQPPGLVVTNAGVEIMRDRLLRQQIYDLHYASVAAEAVKQAKGPAWQLSTLPLSGRTPEIRFAGRVPGEESAYIYRVDHRP